MRGDLIIRELKRNQKAVRRVQLNKRGVMLAHHTSPQTIRVYNRNIAISYTGIYLAKVCFLPNRKIGFISDKYPCKKPDKE